MRETSGNLWKWNKSVPQGQQSSNSLFLASKVLLCGGVLAVNGSQPHRGLLNIMQALEQRLCSFS